MRLKLKRDQLAILEKKIEDYKLICGIDEVGRGPIAGPVVSCAVIMGDNKIEGVKDSKKITDKNRRKFSKLIYENAIAVGFGISDNKLIDEINIRQASLLSMREAVNNLRTIDGEQVIPDILLIDAENIDTKIDQIGIVSGDDLVYEISCASILAKVFRDDLMISYSELYPEYGFESHKGYGTKKHYVALEENGVTEIHRLSFLKKFFEKLDKE